MIQIKLQIYSMKNYIITNIQTINDEFNKQKQISNPIEIPNSNNSIYIEPTTQQEIISLITNLDQKLH